uniref:DNA-(apurinic or apyrimidinic site) endonuclease n=1 Tax=Strigamia maritima TaxID=126957 RepID=T1J0E6_STRMM
MDGKIKVMSWNINGIRTSKDSIKDLLHSFNCDVLCLQETKLTRDQLDEETAILDGVATICRNEFTPMAAEEGLSGVNYTFYANEKDVVGHYGDILDNWSKDELISLDSEGRSVVTKHRIKTHEGKDEFLTIINVYCPHASVENGDRLKYKFQFFELLKQRAQLLIDNDSHVIILGDLNAIHKEIDSAHTIEFTKGREWLDSLVISLPETGNFDEIPENSKTKFVDTFRHCHPLREEAFTCWCTKLGARTLNFGTRLDYILANVDFAQRTLDSSDIHPEIKGSDHCPVTAQFKCHPIASKTPFLCTKNWPEFAGKQQTLKSFFQKIDKTEKTNNSPLKKKQKTTTNQRTLSTFFKKQNRQETKNTESSSQSSQETKNRESSSQSSQETKNTDAADKWKNMFKKTTAPPFCSGHNEPSVLRTVKKSGANLGRQFYFSSQ